MIKLRTIKVFTLEKFNELKNLKRATGSDNYGVLYVGDTFECNEEMAKYLTGDNKLKLKVAEVIEIIPEAVIEPAVIEPIITEPVTEIKEEPKLEPKKKPKKKKK